MPPDLTRHCQFSLATVPWWFLQVRFFFWGLYMLSRMIRVTRVMWFQTPQALGQHARPPTSLQSSSTVFPPEIKFPSLNEGGQRCPWHIRPSSLERKLLKLAQLTLPSPALWLADHHWCVISVHWLDIILLQPCGSLHLPFVLLHKLVPHLSEHSLTQCACDCRGWSVCPGTHLLWFPSVPYSK